MANYSFQDPDLPDDSTINMGNFSQFAPNTEIMKGKTLTINGGNFTNVKKQPEWTVTGGNWTQLDFCSHLHKDWNPHGLFECEIECSHMTDKDIVTIDGIVIDTIYQYEDTLI